MIKMDMLKTFLIILIIIGILLMALAYFGVF